MTTPETQRKKLTAVDWQRASSLAVRLAEDDIFVRLIRQLSANPTHHNHRWQEPDDFEIGVEGCRRCEAFFALPFTILENLKSQEGQ